MGKKSVSYNVERGLISKLIETKDLLTVKDLQMRASYFSGEHKRAYQFIFDTAINTGEVPTVRTFEKKFPNYELESYIKEGKDIVGTEESLKHWCNEVRLKTKHNTLAETLETAIALVGEFKTEEAYAELKKKISFIESEVVETSDVDITKNTEDRKKAYLKRRDNKGMQGLSYGIPLLDYITKGLKNETLTTIIAPPGVGKTWFEILIGAYNMLQGCTVLQGVTEMSEDIMRDRYEAMLFAMCYGSMNYALFKDGNLPLDTEQAFFEFLENDLPNLEPLILFTATSPMGVSAEIDKYNADLVLIDGAYLMEDDQQAKDDWLRVTHITRDLKKIAKRSHKPVVINTQADKSTSKKTGPEMGNISYTQAIGQDSDDIIALFRDEIMINDSEMCAKIIKQREGTLGKVMMNWNFSTMDFSGIYGDSSFDKNNSNDVELKNNTFEVDD
jgi:replicative DNA helicase